MHLGCIVACRAVAAIGKLKQLKCLRPLGNLCKGCAEISAEPPAHVQRLEGEFNLLYLALFYQ